MNKYILIIFLTMFSMMTVSATEKADTITVDNNYITQLLSDTTKNSKGKEIVKYYFIYKGELINTSKTVHDKYLLCKKYNTKLAMAIVKKRSNKRIILN